MKFPSLLHRIPKFLYIEIGILFLLSLTPLLWIGNGYVILGHDSGFRINVAHHMQMLWNTFNPSINTGVDWSLYKGFLVIQLPEFFLQSILGSLELAQPVILICWFFLMSLSMYVFIFTLFHKKDDWFIRLYTSIFWVFNFYILQAWFIAERAKFSLYIALPISILLLILTFEKKIKIVTGAILFGLLYFLFNGGGSPPLFGATIVVWGITWLFYSINLYRKEQTAILYRSIVTILIFLLSFVLFNAYWIFPQIDLIRGTYSSALSSEGGVEGLVAWEKEISKYASIPNLLRMQGLPDWYNNPSHPYAQPYINNIFLILASTIPFLSIVIGFWVFRANSEARKYNKISWLFFLLLLVGLFFASGSHLPTGYIYLFMMRKIPGFAIFRSSFFKFAPVLWLSLIVLSGFYLRLFLQSIPKRKKLIAVSVLIFVLLYHVPFFSHSFFQFSETFTTRVRLPSYVVDVGRKLDEGDKSGRVLVLPQLDTGFINKPIDTYTWGYYSLDILPRIVSSRMIVANDSPYEIVDSLYKSIKKGDFERFRRLASVLNITDILYRGDVRLSSVNELISEETIKTMVGESTYRKGKWSIYTITSQSENKQTFNEFVPAINTLSQSMFASSTTPSASVNWETAVSSAKIPVIFEAECYYCAQNEYDSYQHSISLPAIKLLPNSPFYKLLIGRKQQPISTLPDNPQSIDILLSSSMLKLGEYVVALQKSVHRDVQEAIRKEYMDATDALTKRVSELRDRNRDIYTSRVLAFLDKQKELTTENLSDINAYLTPKVTELQSHLWITDTVSYRYGVTVPVEGQYFIRVNDPAITSIQINGVESNVSKTTPLQAGYYQIEIRKNSPAKPTVLLELQSFTKIEKTTDPISLFVYPFTFDSRWKLVTKSQKSIQQVLVNGYANGWILSKNDNVSTFDLRYMPQRVFIIGFWVSLTSLIVGGYYLITLIRRNHHKLL